MKILEIDAFMYLLKPYLWLENKLTTGVSKGGESEGARTQLRGTVFHFRSILLCIAAGIIRLLWGEPNFLLSYIQVPWLTTSLVAWVVYLSKSATATPIIEPGDGFTILVFGFFGGLLIGKPIATLIDYLISSSLDHDLFEHLRSVIVLILSGFISFMFTAWVGDRIKIVHSYFLYFFILLWGLLYIYGSTWPN